MHNSGFKVKYLHDVMLPKSPFTMLHIDKKDICASTVEEKTGNIFISYALKTQECLKVDLNLSSTCFTGYIHCTILKGTDPASLTLNLTILMLFTFQSKSPQRMGYTDIPNSLQLHISLNSVTVPWGFASVSCNYVGSNSCRFFSEIVSHQFQQIQPPHFKMSFRDSKIVPRF